MTQKEQARLQVLNSLMAEHMTLDQAATLMGVSERHTRRILATYQERGVAAVAHGHRGRRPANAIPESPPTRRSPIASKVAQSDTIADQPSDISAEHLDGHLC